jgi:predicted Fe-Mo cluster-binding NifX family protein
MRICIPTADDSGLDSRLNDHFGSAPFLALVDTEAETVDIVPNRGHHHDHRRCKPIEHVDVDRTDAVVCHGMGKRAVASLRKGGLDVYVTDADRVRDAIAEARAGTLEELSVDDACGGRGRRERRRDVGARRGGRGRGRGQSTGSER